MAGKDYKFYISDDGTAAGNKQLVEAQGDFTLNPGVTQNKTAYKDKSKTALGRDGFTGTFTMGLDEPASAGQVLLLDAFDNDGKIYGWFETETSGGFSYAGNMSVIIDQAEFPVDGEPSYSIALSEDGVVSRSTVA